MAREDQGSAPRGGSAIPFDCADALAEAISPKPGQHVRLGDRQGAMVGILALAALVMGLIAPRQLMIGAYWGFFCVFLTGAAIRLAALLTPRRQDHPPLLSDDHLPTYTLIVPLYREAEVAAELVANLDRLDYPRDRLQALVVLEADDVATRSAFRLLDLPSFIQVLVVPPGEPRTKPRACNVALTLARGELLVIYDAEDAPDPLQLREAASRFAAQDSGLACLQAPLRIEAPSLPAFIPQQFRLEYAALFEVLIPAYARWGLPFPLGGTSNHFRTQTLRKIGGWDAYNVTEDADIGFRLALAGYRLGAMERPTLETAPSCLAQWGPQRARWIKGHLQTLATHGKFTTLRHPRALAALVITLAVPIASSNLHAPVMIIAALSLAADWMADGQASIAIADLTLYAFGWSVSAICGALGVRRSGGAPRLLHLLGMAGYWMMWIIASPRALWQFFFAPHHWDKTSHTPRTAPRAGPSTGRAAP